MMTTYIKVLVVVLSVTWGCQGDRLNHRSFVFPDEDIIIREGPTPNARGGPNANINNAIHFGPPQPNAGQPSHHQPPSNVPRQPETINNRVDFPAPTPSPRPVTPPAAPVTPPAAPVTPPAVPVTLPPRPTAKPACAANLECDAPCEHDEEYNSTIRARMDDLINIHGGVNAFLKDPELKNLLTEVVVPGEDFPSLRGGVIETAICHGEEKVIIPERAKTENGEWAFVLNQGSARQAIKYEKCIREGRKCNLGAAGSEIDTVCRQKYIYRTMLVMDGQGTKILPEQVLMPSCCICYVVKPFNGFGRVAPRKDGC